MKLKDLHPKTIILLVLAGLVLIFIIQNSASVSINFFFWKMTIPRVFLIAGSVVVGVVIGILYPSKK